MTESEKAARKCTEQFDEIEDPEETFDFLKILVPMLTTGEMQTLVQLLGQSASDSICSQADKFMGNYNDLDDLCDYSLSPYIDNCDPVVLSFIISCCNRDVNDLNTKDRYLLARIMESLYRFSYPHIIYPLAFMQNLCTYVTTRSKLAVNLSAPL